MNTARRRFLQAATAVPLALTDASWLASLAAFGAEPVPERIQFGPDLEPIVRLIEETPRDQCVRVFVEQLRGGLPYRRLLAASLFASIRRLHSHHEVYKIHSLHQVSMDVRAEERLLPLFWALNGYKQRQEDFPGPAMTVLSGPLPAADKAGAELRDAMERLDLGRAEAAVVALGQDQGARPTMELLWQYGCRNGSAGGHAAIAVANCFRALEAIGWQQAEPALRFVIQDWFALGYVRPDRYHQPNQARVDQHLSQLPASWAGERHGKETAPQSGAARRELLALIRDGQVEPACTLAVQQLQRGVGAQALWDAVHLATAELLVRHHDGWGLASRPLHSNTSTNALHYAYRTCTIPATRLLVLLQAIAWAADKTAGDRNSRSLRDLSIIDLPGQETVPERLTSAEAVTEVFAQLPSRHYRWDAGSRKAVLAYGSRADADAACRKVFTLTRSRPGAGALFVQAAHSWLCRKASNDTHEYKFLAAMFENVEWVSPEWRPHLLAASVHYLHGSQSPDNEVVRQAREALSKGG
jgi:hypothetical protein